MPSGLELKYPNEENVTPDRKLTFIHIPEIRFAVMASRDLIVKRH